MTGYDPTHKPSAETVESSVPMKHGDEEFSGTSDEEIPDDPTEQSGHMHPAENPTAEVVQVTEDAYSSVGAPVLKNDPFTLSASPVSVTLSPPSVEVKASSPEIVTFHPEHNVSPEPELLEDIQDKIQQEGSGENPEVFQNTPENHLEERERDSSEGSGDPSGENPPTKPDLFLTNPTLPGGHTSMCVSETFSDAHEKKITLIPHLTLKPDWEPEPSSSTLQESRSDREYSADSPVTVESDDISHEQGRKRR